ncbi:hypothetical protein ACTFIR_011373 [Dictyostelium discoideum]
MATTIPLKEAVVVILDIGLGMTSKDSDGTTTTSSIEDALRSVTLLYQQKLIYGKKDQLGLVLIGTKGTKNNLQDDGYQHITVVSDIEEPSIETLKYLENLAPGESKGDVIDSLIVAMDMLIRKTENKKYQKRIFLVTNARDPINTEDLSIVRDQFKKIDVKLNIIGVDFLEEIEENDMDTSNNNNNKSLKEKNEIFLREFAESVDGVLVPVKQALEMMSFFRSQSVMTRTSFRGALEITPELKIPVWGYLKMKQQLLPSLKKISSIAQQQIEQQQQQQQQQQQNKNKNNQDNEDNEEGKPNITLDVNQEVSYYSITDPDNEILKPDLLKGYKYGKSLIPFSKIDEDQLKYSSSKCLKVVGFTDRKSIPIYYNMGNTEVFVSQPGDKQSEEGLSSFIHALVETDQVMVVRYVKTMNGSPYLGYMIPHVKSDYVCLYYNHLPLADDIRQYQFPPISPKNPLTRKSNIPNAEQLEATQQLIDSMDLMKSEFDEDGDPIQMLKPRFTYNPLLQHFYQCLHHRSLHPNTQIPKLDPIIAEYINPDQIIMNKSKQSIKNFADKFPLTKTTVFSKTPAISGGNTNGTTSNTNNTMIGGVKYHWKDGMLIGEEINLDSYVTDDGSEAKKRKVNDFSEFSLDKLVSGYVTEVGTINPVQNFKDMLNRRDMDLVDKAITLMKERILQLVNDSLRDQYYQKAFECIKELRVGCIRESEAEQFNVFLKEMRSLFQSKKRDDFWQYITADVTSILGEKSINLITQDECDSSEVTQEELDQFLDKKVKQFNPPPITNVNTDSVDDLFDQIE